MDPSELSKCHSSRDQITVIIVDVVLMNSFIYNTLTIEIVCPSISYFKVAVNTTA